jgi:hypothetical protein
MSKPVPKPVPVATRAPVDSATGLSDGPFEPAGRDRTESGRVVTSDIINCDSRLWALLHQEKKEEPVAASPEAA